MMHPDDYDDTIRHTPGAFALMAAVFEHALQDAAHPRYRLSALRWLLSTGAIWAVEYGGADPAAYRERIRSIKVTKTDIVWVDAQHFIGPMCKRNHEYQGSGGTLRRQYAQSSSCPLCDAETNREFNKRKVAARQLVSATMYVGPLCKRGHEHENSGGSLRYKSNAMCLECERLSQLRRGRYQPHVPAEMFVGGLCQRGHKHEGQEASLRYVKNKHCVECQRLNSIRYRDERRKLEEAV
jgi:hypothetical protein